MLLSGLYMAFRLKLMFSLFAGNPKQNSEPKYHLMKDRINEFVHQFRYNILQMQNADFHNSPLALLQIQKIYRSGNGQIWRSGLPQAEDILRSAAAISI